MSFKSKYFTYRATNTDSRVWLHMNVCEMLFQGTEAEPEKTEKKILVPQDDNIFAMLPSYCYYQPVTMLPQDCFVL